MEVVMEKTSFKKLKILINQKGKKKPRFASRLKHTESSV
jgi:hypothetical protein